MESTLCGCDQGKYKVRFAVRQQAQLKHMPGSDVREILFKTCTRQTCYESKQNVWIKPPTSNL